MKRVLVTGASGFIGRHTLSHLHASGFEIHTADLRDLPAAASGQHHHANLFDPQQVREIMAIVRPSHLLHLAWDVVPGQFWTSLQNVRWVQASLELLLEFAAVGGRRCVGAGTCAEYDWTLSAQCREEETPLKPATLYGACKAALSLLQSRLAAQAGMSSAWCRVFHLYGPFEPPNRLVSSVAAALLQGQPAECTHGTQERDFVYVDDVARAFVHVLDSEFSGSVNISSGQPVAIRELAQLVAEIVGRPELLRLGARPQPSDEPLQLVGDASRLRQLGFSPRFSLQEGVSETVAWWRHRL